LAFAAIFVEMGVLQIGIRAMVIENKSDVFSEPPTSDIEDAFSSNSPDYTLASPDYFSASPGNTSSDSLNNSYGLVTIESPTLSLFHDDPYMKVMHAYDAIIPPQVLSQLFCLHLQCYHQYLILKNSLFLRNYCHLKSKTYLPSLSSTYLSNPSRKQACILVPPSFSVYTPTPPQIFEIGKISIKMHLKHHEKQIEDILNYLEELSFY
nr:hypothetical protein [Tanacetum cinerariifolium]